MVSRTSTQLLTTEEKGGYQPTNIWLVENSDWQMKRLVQISTPSLREYHKEGYWSLSVRILSTVIMSTYKYRPGEKVTKWLNYQIDHELEHYVKWIETSLIGTNFSFTSQLKSTRQHYKDHARQKSEQIKFEQRQMYLMINLSVHRKIGLNLWNSILGLNKTIRQSNK